MLILALLLQQAPTLPEPRNYQLQRPRNPPAPVESIFRGPNTDLEAAKAETSVVVTGQRLTKLKAELDDCIARRCPPERDISLTLAYAETQFIMGDYHGGRDTMLAARKRNARFAAQLPVDVSDMHRATGLFANLTGHPNQNQTSAIDAIDALKKGLPENDARIYVQRLEIGDAMQRNGSLEAALSQYDKVARQGREAGLPLVEGMAMFRSAALLSALASVTPRFTLPAQEQAERILKNTSPAFLPFRNGVRMLQARLAPSADRPAAMQAALARLEADDDPQPTLLVAPPIKTQDMAFGAAHGTDKPLWADVSFFIAPDGKVADVAVVQQTDGVRPQWMELITRSIAERRYAPQRRDQDLPRLERYSFIADTVAETRSRMRTRKSGLNLQVTDLSPVPKSAPAAPTKTTAPTPQARPVTTAMR
ncbi:hypothetical protein N4G62_15775 [Sphingomonas sanguinis]|uniref:TonB C-terminal domain-containing protein n=1 Tax=Sphingomonas sanguinis TaxID=33051 RepID=A0ABU5LU75_9SPHN|nr:hypothetical protein [Sphingomonas sanguinis]MDZ7283488.1 hypothetical protein [Sphingomonas sanguinis]